MQRACPLLALTSTLALLLGPGCRLAGPEERVPPEPRARAIVLVTVDGLVPEELSVFGGARPTPALKRLAEAGAAWSDVWTACPMTRPAAATYLSGLAPDRHGVRDDLFAALAEGTPTLATLLAARGFATGAFPDSAFLGPTSGLLGGFDVVADPPSLQISPARWLPFARDPEEVADDATAWIASLPREKPYFAWVHLSQPLNEKSLAGSPVFAPMLSARAEEAKAVDQADAAIGRVLDAVEAHGDLDAALIVVAGTQGDPSGGGSEPPGPGLSLEERALRVPLVVRPPQGAPALRADRTPVWAPDVAATVAEIGAVSLDPRAEGASLFAEAPDDRVVFAWSWARLDQLAWPAQRAARRGPWKLLEDGDERSRVALDPDAAGGEALEPLLGAALDGREEPAAPSVPFEAVEPLLRRDGIEPVPAPPGGRAFGDAQTRRQVAEKLLSARVMARLGYIPMMERTLHEALELDPDGPAARLDLVQYYVATGHGGEEEARELARRAVTLYPTRPEPLHWYAHTLWSTSWQQAEELLRVVAPRLPHSGDIQYDLACARSLAGDLDASVAHLRRAIDAGYRPWSYMEVDPDLRNLRESGRFAEVVREYRQ